MRISALFCFSFSLMLLMSPSVSAQADQICSEFGGGIMWSNKSAVYGRVEIGGLSESAKLPKVTVALVAQGRTLASMTVGRSGNYCFRDVNGAGGTLILTVEDTEFGRQDLPSGGLPSNQFRQDFAIDVGGRTRRPGVISAKYSYKREGKNEELFTTASTHLREKKYDKALPLLEQIVATDPKDFAVWTMLGSIYSEMNNLGGAEAAYFKALEANAGYVVAMASLGQVFMGQKKLEPAIAILVRATEAEPEFARAHRLLGEAYLLSKKGTLGLESLYRAIEIDPKGMAECHLLAARLFESAGAKSYASREYKLFLEKVPEYSQKKALLKYIQDNPPATDK
jgi:Tfp pilus assembly protein PilF